MLIDQRIPFSTWLDPVLYRVRGIGLTSPPPSPRSGDIYVDISNRYLQFDGSAFVVIGIASDEDRVINLDSTTTNIFEFFTDSTSWVDQGTEEDRSVVMVQQDTNGRTEQYYYDRSLDRWIRAKCDKNVDGGSPCDVYLPVQNVDGGGPCD
jgi:hypothetical protein